MQKMLIETETNNSHIFLIIISIAALQQLLCDLDTVYLRFGFGFSLQLPDIWI